MIWGGVGTVGDLLLGLVHECQPQIKAYQQCSLELKKKREREKAEGLLFADDGSSSSDGGGSSDDGGSSN